MENELLLLMLEERWFKGRSVKFGVRLNRQHVLVPCSIITRQHLMEYIEEYKSIESFFTKYIRSVCDY